jgi:class 3 adenylate cyclase
LGQVVCRLGEAHFLAGSPARGQRHLEEGVRVLEENGERRTAAHYRIQLGSCCAQRAQPQRARTEWERARQVLEPEGPSEDLAYACVHLASLQALQWESEPALALAEHAVAVAEAARATAPRTLAYSAIGIMLTRLGRVEEGLAYLDRACSEAMAHGLRWIAGNALMNGVAARTEHFRAREAHALVERLLALGVSHQLQAARAEGLVFSALGDPLKALGSWERAVALAREREAATFVRRSERGLAATYAALGRFDEALRLLPDRGGAADPERQDTLQQARAAIRVLLDANDLAGALRETQPVIESTDWGPLPGKRWLHDAAVEALVQAGRTADAERLVRQSRSPAADAEVNPYQARMEGRLALARGQGAAAAHHLAAALEGFRQAGYREEESRTRRVLSAARIGEGDRTAAEAELHEVLAYASAHGAVLEGECARRQLAALGVIVDAPRPVGQPIPDDLQQPSERLVTVMFVDVRGYTALTARHAPAQMVEMVAAFQRSVRREIERRHGLLDKFAGDAAMATFNVSGARLDHSLHALQAALAIRDRAASGDFPVGIGIAVGPAVVGALTEGSNVSVVGEATNLAARLQGEAAAGEVLLSEEAYRRVRSWLQERRISPRKEQRTFKGFAQPIVFHRLLAPAEQGRGGVRDHRA